jgi:trimethylamine---corrinoid protein Co-methyltransferase
MVMQTYPRNTQPFKLLTEKQIKQIQDSTLHVLAKTGVVIQNNKALDLLATHGCDIDSKKSIARFPETVVQENLAVVPRRIRIKARVSDYDIELNTDQVCFFNQFSKETVDLETGEAREPTRKEFYEFVKVLDALPSVHGVSVPYFGFADVPQAMRSLEGNAAIIRMSPKVPTAGETMGNGSWNREIAKIVGVTPVNFVGTMSPLAYSDESISQIFSCCKNGIPFEIDSGSISGATSPVTIAGSVVAGNAEIIAGMVLTQIIKKGHPVWPGNFIFAQNMRTGAPAFGAITNVLLDGVFNQVWQNYGIPVASSTASIANSKLIDFQTGHETAQGVTLSAISGANCVFFHGTVSQQLTGHPVKAILDDDVVKRVGRFLEGVEVSPETLAVDLIDQVGTIPGTFLTTKHTHQWFRKELCFTEVADESIYDNWLNSGKKTALRLAMDKMENILKKHETVFLTNGQEQEIENILNDARKFYRKKGLIRDEEWRSYQKNLVSDNYPYA